MIRLAAIAILAPVAAGAFTLDWPIDCTLGETCHIQQYMDRDPGPDHTDFTCGPLSYDGHKGTDIAVPTLSDMRRGVTVRAAAPGVVKGVRDGMEDISIRAANAPDIEGRECGNGLVVDHGDGWETQYCHMKKGSVLKSKGDSVAAGEALGLVGLSGQTEFPHLHVSVRKDGAEIDPFDPDGAAGCGEGPEPALWADAVPYEPGGLIAIGLAAEVPKWDALKDGLPDPGLTTAAPALVVWAYFFGNRIEDQIELTITAPDGSVIITDRVPLEKAQAQGFRAIGKKLREAAWPAGDYRIDAALLRAGAEIDRQTQTITLR